MLVDLDHFKSINDTHGHATGDEVLVHFASHCSRAVRQLDKFGRYGGEEFLVVLPEADRAAAQAVVERVRGGLTPVARTDAAPLAYTFSAGVAEARPGESLASVLARADAALYRAKANGRARSELA